MTAADAQVPFPLVAASKYNTPPAMGWLCTLLVIGSLIVIRLDKWEARPTSRWESRAPIV